LRSVKHVCKESVSFGNICIPAKAKSFGFGKWELFTKENRKATSIMRYQSWICAVTSVYHNEQWRNLTYFQVIKKPVTSSFFRTEVTYTSYVLAEDYLTHPLHHKRWCKTTNISFLSICLVNFSYSTLSCVNMWMQCVITHTNKLAEQEHHLSINKWDCTTMENATAPQCHSTIIAETSSYIQLWHHNHCQQ